MYVRCPRCGKVLRDPGYDFVCRSCGYMFKSREEFFAEDEDDEIPPVVIFREMMREHGFTKALIILILNMFRVIGMYSYTAAAILCIFVLTYGVSIVMPADANRLLSLYIVTPSVVPYYSLGGNALKSYYFMLVIVIMSSFAYIAVKEGKKTLRIYIDSLRTFTPPSRKMDNTFIMIVQVFLSVFAFNTIYSFILYSLEINPATPSFASAEMWYLHILFANASVYEEISVRMLLLGIPLLTFYFFTHIIYRKGSMKEFLKSKCGGKLHRFITGGGFKVGVPETAFLIISSLFFALAHYYGGWDVWKLAPTFVAGLGMGYLFLKKGIHAAIILHFSFDFLGLSTMQFDYLSTYIAPLAVVWFPAGLFYMLHYLGIMGHLRSYMLKK